MEEVLENLKAQRQNLVLERSQLKDVLEKTETALAQLNVAVQAIEVGLKADEESNTETDE